MRPIRLNVAVAEQNAGRFAGMSLKQIRAWRESLPRGDASAYAAALSEALLGLNCAQLKNRFEVMELLRPDVYDVCSMLLARYKNSALPLRDEQQDAADAAQGLLRELSTGFKLVVNEQLDAWEAGASENITRVLQVATQRALLALGRGLLESYRVYASEPAELWSDVYRLYRNAELCNLQSLPIEGTRDCEETALSIKQAFLRSAVLALANPYHLMQGEAEELYRRIGRWVHFIRLNKPAGADSEALLGHFVIDLESDFPARYLPRTVKAPMIKEPRVLELDQLVATIDGQIERCNETLAQNSSSVTLSQRMQRDMYIRFRRALGGRQERQDERKPTVARLTLVEGLSACHFFLSGKRPFAPEQDEAGWEQRRSQTESKPAFQLALQDDDDAKRDADVSAGRTSSFKAMDAEVDDVWRKATMVKSADEDARRQKRSRYRAMDWHRKNQSQGGMALFCVRDCGMQVRVGELVAYSENERVAPDQWCVGTVRWLRTRPREGLELGIKRLAENAYPVGTKAVTGAGMGSEYLRGVLLPRVNPVLKEATLVTPEAVYDVGSVLRLNLGELVLYAKLTDLIETTRLFAHFRFRVIQAPMTEQQKKR